MRRIWLSSRSAREELIERAVDKCASAWRVSIHDQAVDNCEIFSQRSQGDLNLRFVVSLPPWSAPACEETVRGRRRIGEPLSQYRISGIKRGEYHLGVTPLPCRGAEPFAHGSTDIHHYRLQAGGRTSS